MPEYIVTSPEGKKFKINAPDGATQEEVLAYAQESFKAEPTTEATAAPQFQHPFEAMFGTKGGKEVGQDALLLGFGNEAKAGAKALFGDGTYAENMAESQRIKEDFKQNDPANYMRSMVAGGAGSGSLVGAATKPKTFLQGLGLGATTGAVEGAGTDEEDRLKGLGLGAMFGGGGGLAGEALLRALPLLNSAGKGLKGLFVAPKEPGTQQATAEAYDILSNIMGRSGKTVTDVVGDSTRLGPQANVADLLGDEGAETLNKVSRMSSKARNAVADSPLPARTADTIPRTRAGLGTTSDDIADSVRGQQHLDALEKNAGKDIDNYVNENATVPLANQQKLAAFVNDRPEVLKAARKAMNRSRSGRDIQFEEGTNAPIIDVELEGYIRKELQSKVNTTGNALTKDSVANARAIDQANQWSEMADKAAPEELKVLRLDYGVKAANSRAYRDGLKFTGMKESDAVRYFDNPKLTTAEREAFKAGAIENLGNTGEGVSNILGKTNQQAKLGKVFGEDEAKKMLDTLKREEVFAKTASKQASGAATGMSEDIAANVSGDTRDFILGGSLRGKRAYSEKGAGFMLINEIIDSARSLKVSETTQRELAKILTNSEDIGNFIAKLEKTKLSLDGIKFKEHLKLLKRPVSTGAVSGLLGAGKEDK